MTVKSNRIFLPGNHFLIAYLAFLSAFAPLATDMYLPALPVIAEHMNVDDALASSTLSSFMLVFAISMLIWGPLSDKYGRKPVLIGGCIVFIISSAAIALTGNFWTLFFWRLAQALGSGSASSMALAIVRDLLRGSMMEKVVSSIQAATIIAPMIAPVLGGWLLYFVSWRGIFWCLAICGGIAIAGALAMRETCYKKSSVSTFAIFGRIGAVLAQKDFRRLLALFSLASMPFMSYLAVSTFIYQDMFRQSAQAFSMFFALNAGCSLFGPLAHMFILRHYDAGKVISLHLAAMTLGGILVIAWGGHGPWTFALLFLPISFCGSAMRPPSTVLTMESIRGDNGVVASLINCGGLVFGSLAMSIATMAFWSNPVIAVGTIAAVVSGACLTAWLLIKR